MKTGVTRMTFSIYSGFLQGACGKARAHLPHSTRPDGEWAMKPEKGEQRRLLVVDDEPTIVSLLSASLRFVGFEVRTAATGAEALAVAAEFKPELLVLDVMLPDCDGFEVVRRLRAN